MTPNCLFLFSEYKMTPGWLPQTSESPLQMPELGGMTLILVFINFTTCGTNFIALLQAK